MAGDAWAAVVGGMLPELLNERKEVAGKKVPITLCPAHHFLLGWQPVARKQASLPGQKQGREGGGRTWGGKDQHKDQIPALWTTDYSWRRQVNK